MGQWGRLDRLIDEPPLLPGAFCAAQPCTTLRVGGSELVLGQPSSTLLVYLLAVVGCAAGWRVLARAAGQRSRLWWGASLLLGGVGAFLAGTSYQAFGYEIKCAGREVCVWTSGWEVAYLVLAVASANAMLVAVAWARATGRRRTALFAVAALASAVHLLLTVVGVVVPVRFLVSFELLVLFAAPWVPACLLLLGWRWRRLREPLDGALVGAAALLLAVIAAYYAWLTLGFTERFWARGVWLPANDVLHAGMLVWVLYALRRVAPRLRDFGGQRAAG
jgi:hypothetical protein